jgi:hypothetical protein
MKVSVNNNNTVTDYFFAPEHKENAIGFYTSAYWGGMIQGFVATLEDGTIVAIGAN